MTRWKKYYWLAIPVRHLQKTPVLAKLVKTSSQPEERNRKIVELYLRAWNTQEAIADVMGVDRTVVTRIVQKDSSGDLHNDFKPPIYNIVKKFEIANSGEIEKTFKPPIYNIWNLAKR